MLTKTLTNRSRRRRVHLATAAGLAASTMAGRHARAQQNPNDQTVFLNASDAAGVSSFTSGTNFQASSSAFATTPYTNAAPLSAGTAPAAGYAYVDTGTAAGTGVIRTPTTGAAYTFGGDSLAILAFNGQANLFNTSTTIPNPVDTSAALELYGPNNSAVTVNNLILGNGGAVIHELNTTAVLNGQIDLLPANTTLDGVTTTVSGGIIDNNVSQGNFIINATLVGSGQLRLISSHGISRSTITLNGSSGSNFTGGVIADNTAGGAAAASGSALTVNVNTPAALGTGTFTIQSINPTTNAQVSSVLTIDNTTGANETLTTNNAQQWNGGFTFGGTNSLNMGSGTVTLGASEAVLLPKNVLAVGGVANPAGSSYTLTVSASSVSNGATVGGALEVPTLASITSGLSVAAGGTLAFPAATNTPQQLAGYASSMLGQGELASNVYQSANVGIDTTGVTGGTYNLSTGLPTGNYGLNKVGAGTLVLTTPSVYSGGTSITGGTLQFATNNPLPNTGFLDLGFSTTTGGTLDVNGFSATLPQPEGGSTGGVITNSNASTAATVTFNPSNYASHSPATYFGSITGNLSVVYNFPAPTASTTTSIFYSDQSTSTYTGATTLQSGVISVSKAGVLPTTTQGIFFAGGILNPTASNLDFSPGFSQAANQQYAVAWQTNGIVTPFATSLNSSGGSLTVGNTNAYLAGVSTLIVSAANNYSGATTVTSGTLQVANVKGLAGTSGVTVATAGSNPSPSAYSTVVAGTLSINDSSGTVGITGGVAGGAPITLSLNGLGSASTSIATGTSYYGFAFYGGLQGVPGGTAVWAGNVALPSANSGLPAGISGGLNNGSSGGTLTVTGTISGSGPLTLGLNAGSTTVLAGANTYTGETQINCSTGSATTVRLGANNAIPAVSGLNFESNFALVASALGRSTTPTFGTETFDLNRYSTSVAYLANMNAATTTNDNFAVNGGAFVDQTTPAAVVNSVAGTTSTLTVAGDVNGLYANSTAYTAVPTFSGAIAETATSGKVALAMNAAGFTQALAGASNYSGGTTVSAGTLQANGPRVLSGTTLATSSTGLGMVVVSGSGVLAGTGGTGPVVVAAGGTITAGTGATTADTMGTLTTGAQSWNASGAYAAKVATGGTANDELVMSGLTVAANSSSPFAVNVVAGSTVSLAPTAQLVLAVDTNTSQSGVFANAAAANALVLTGAAVTFTNGAAPVLAEVDVGGGEELVLAAAPEPTSLLLVAAAAAPVALGRRRRRRA